MDAFSDYFIPFSIEYPEHLALLETLWTSAIDEPFESGASDIWTQFGFKVSLLSLFITNCVLLTQPRQVTPYHSSLLLFYTLKIFFTLESKKEINLNPKLEQIYSRLQAAQLVLQIYYVISSVLVKKVSFLFF